MTNTIINKLAASKNLIYFILGGVLLLVMFGGLFIAGSPKKKEAKASPGSLTEITIENDKTKLTVKRNGVVEVRSGDKVFYQFWEKDRVDRLFSLLEKADFSGFGSKLKPGEEGYLLTLTTDQGTITIAIPGNSEIIPDIVKELIETLEEISEQIGGGSVASPLPSLLPLGSATPTPTATPFATPTPTATPFATPTPTATPTAPGAGGGTPSPQELFVCEYTGSTGRVRVLSETLCDLVE